MRGVLAALLLLASTLAVCADDFVVIGEDGGGEVTSYLRKYDAIKKARTPVILVGECDSACTLVLTLPRWQVCATPGSVLGFHGVSHTLGGPIDLDASRKVGRLFYPRSVWPYLEHKEIHYEPARKFFGACRRG